MHILYPLFILPHHINMSRSFSFDINKYLGTWYQLMMYPSWFQRNDNYNTTAHYTRNANGTIQVHNSAITNGTKFDSYGVARIISGYNLRVDFPNAEIDKLINSGEFKSYQQGLDRGLPNYVIDRIWINAYGEYIFAVVTDLTKQSLYVLSRYTNPSLVAYNEIMSYVIANYDRDRIVQTPHFH